MDATEGTSKATKVKPKYVNAPVAIQKGERISSATTMGLKVAKAMVRTGIVYKNFGAGSLGLNKAVFTLEGDQKVEGYIAYPHCSQFVMYLDNRMRCLGIDTGKGTVGPAQLAACKTVATTMEKELGRDLAKEVAYSLYTRTPYVTDEQATIFRLLDAIVRKTA